MVKKLMSFCHPGTAGRVRNCFSIQLQLKVAIGGEFHGSPPWAVS